MDTPIKRARTKAGSRAIRTHRKNLVGPWLYAFLAVLLASLTVAMLTLAGLVPIWSGLVTILLMYLTFKIWDKETDDSNNTWGTGARAERQVGEELDSLYEVGFHVFHDIQSGAEGEGNIDHLLIGREGAFVIETKSWQGVITSEENRDREPELKRNGKWLRYCNPLSQARWGAAKASELIGDVAGRKPYVTPVVCFSQADVRLYGKVGGVEVSELGALKRVVLQGRRQSYTEEQVRKMAEAVTQKIGYDPSSAPGVPPEEPSRAARFTRWFLDLPSLYLTLCFVFMLSIVFPGQFLEFFGALSVLYRVLSEVYGYYLF